MVFSLSKGDRRIQSSLSFCGNLPSGILPNREGTGFHPADSPKLAIRISMKGAHP